MSTQPNPIVGSIPQPPNAFQIASRMIEMGAYVYFIPQGTKACTEKGWPELATRDLSIAGALAGDKHLNVMVVGKRDGIWVLDFDDVSVLEEYEKSFGQIETYRVRSVSGGIHLYFLPSPAAWEMGNLSEKSADGKKELWSARIDNKYVLAPYSVAHPHNDETKPLTYYTTTEKLPVVAIPDSLITYLKARAGKNIDKPAVEVEKTIVTEGGRNNWLASMAGKARQVVGMNEDELLSYLRRLNSEQCQPTLSDAEVRAIARSIGGYPIKPTGELVMTQQTQTQNQQPNKVDVSNWPNMFRSVSEMEEGEIVMVINGVLQEGTCFIGGNPGGGKTLVALSFAKAICTGTPLFGLPQFSVSEPRTVIYLIPESRDRAFRKRCESFRMPTDKRKFMARTITAGVPLALNDPYLLEAVRQTKAVVFLDTASRFMKSADENAAAQNRELVNDVVALLAAGAVCVVLVHHATKESKSKAMTLENMLRGTSDLGAMCDSAFGVRKDELLYQNGAGPAEITIVNLKDRELVGELTTMRLAATYKNTGDDFPVSHIAETGDFVVLGDKQSTSIAQASVLAEIVRNDPHLSYG